MTDVVNVVLGLGHPVDRNQVMGRPVVDSEG